MGSPESSEFSRVQFYRRICHWVIRSGVLKCTAMGRARGTLAVDLPVVVSNEAPVWFHAASVGELESLWTVIYRWLAEGGMAVVTVFSDSAITKVRSLALEVEKGVEGAGARLLFAGYSPWEGEWLAAFRWFRPSAFVTVKYEAWPELWASLAEEKIPLLILGAKERSSLKFVSRALGWLKCPLPDLSLLTLLQSDQEPLRKVFPTARVDTTGDPRWDRVFERIHRGSERAKELISALGDLPRPWGVIGSAWKEDLDAFGHRLYQISGTLWVVPHHVDSETTRVLSGILEHGYRPVISTRLLDLQRPQLSESKQRAAVIVDEMGFLAELYAAADWAFVGGGFGAGVHSTIEPAIQGVPIACGPARAQSFAEIEELRSTLQLRITTDADAIAEWLRTLGVLPFMGKHTEVTERDRRDWQEQAKARLGATGRVYERLREKVRNLPVHTV